MSSEIERIRRAATTYASDTARDALALRAAKDGRLSHELLQLLLENAFCRGADELATARAQGHPCGCEHCRCTCDECTPR